jgi:two-component system osmolarity sensor histidine kinase EnvZ
MPRSLKSLLPSGLYGRAALILVLPIVTIQLVVSIAFIQRHFEDVTRQMTRGVVLEIGHLLAVAETAPGGLSAPSVAALARAFDARVEPVAGPAPAGDRRDWIDWSGREVIATLRAGLPALRRVALTETPREVRVWFDGPGGAAEIVFPRRRVSASNPHQLLVLMILASALLTFIAFYFLRAQLRPVAKLAAAAEAFGKGQVVPYRPRGAVEVRAAGRAFLDMRARIERQMEQRTLMLSGISHDLRTPLTRLRLGLSMLPEDAETRALIEDVAHMQRMVDEFLDFARGDATEGAERVDPAVLAQAAVEAALRGGARVAYRGPDRCAAMPLRPLAVARALENLIGNAVRHGTQVLVAVEPEAAQVVLAVEDDGPGIPPARRDEAMLPFSRLDAARDPNRGGGVGLGLSIAADIARSHGGALRLSEGRHLPGLRAELVLTR